jgi:hypothetical protein
VTAIETRRRPVRRFYRLRARELHSPEAGTAVSARVEEDRPDGLAVYLAVGPGRRRMYLTEAEAWALWRCLSEAVASLGDPPDAIRVPITPTGR